MNEPSKSPAFDHVATSDILEVRALPLAPLLAGVAARKDAHLDECSRRFGPGVFRFLGSIAGADSADLLTETFIGLPDKVGAFTDFGDTGSEDEAATRFERWLVRVAHNQWRTRNRSIQRRREDEFGVAGDIAVSKTSVSGVIAKQDAFERAMDGMPSGPREAWALYCQGFGPKEIAAALNIDPNAAAVRIHRAKEYLKPRLRHALGEP